MGTFISLFQSIFTFSATHTLTYTHTHSRFPFLTTNGGGGVSFDPTSGQYYTHIININDDSSIICELLIGDGGVVIYDCNMFIIQATDISDVKSMSKDLSACLLSLCVR